MNQDEELIEDVSGRNGPLAAIAELFFSIIFIIIGVYIGFNLIKVSAVAILIGALLIYFSYRK